MIAVGNPLGFLGALTTGVIHAVGRVPGLGARKWIQAGVRLAPGNSGGPLADAHGRVIGINTMIAGGVGLAVPSNSLADALDLGRNSQRPWLGVVVRRVRAGLMILEVNSGSPAERASLMPGDIVVGLKERTIDSIDDLEHALRGNGESSFRLRFLRGGGSTIRTVTVQPYLARTAA